MERIKNKKEWIEKGEIVVNTVDDENEVFIHWMGVKGRDGKMIKPEELLTFNDCNEENQNVSAIPKSALTPYDEIKMIQEAIAIQDRQCAGVVSKRSAYIKAPESEKS